MFVFILAVCGLPALGLLLAAAGAVLVLRGRNPHAAAALGLCGATLSCFGAFWVVYDLWPDGKVPMISLVPITGFALGAAAAGWGVSRAVRGPRGAPGGRPEWATTGALLIVALLTAAGYLAGFLLGGAYPDELAGPFPDDTSQGYRDRAGRCEGVFKGALGGLALGALPAAAWLLIDWCRNRTRKPADSSSDAIRQALLDLGLNPQLEARLLAPEPPGVARGTRPQGPPRGRGAQPRPAAEDAGGEGMLGDDEGRPGS